MADPFLIEFSKIGSSMLGYISVVQNSELPFEIKRVYWTYFTPDSVVRGHHAHHDLEQIIFATSGKIVFTLEGLDNTVHEFTLDEPNVGLYIPKLFWRTIKFSHNAVLLCLASAEYTEDDYIRSYESFQQLKINHLV
ncbi:WxcM-like domain-containing protein [Hymenobacter oligotrophus]|uniref:WxcM-like domain-containing protein n=1 Tax=Hymenobacter oligotrophus TaxID=2319843 RepID=A0A3B7R893_9BACT|nr:FdtA/QdtA family cupin domain-containing protein [Hymenobacter oligotrophus]AYA37199.1 WxcM-like domain-containing protein [Hymenobacter oligotrophus]